MSKKVGAILFVVIVVVLAWWLLSKGGDAVKEAVRDDAAGAVAGAPQACGADLACGNALLTACKPGSFVGKTERQETAITVVERDEVSCKITSSLALAALGPFAKPALDVNKDGKLEMACDVPLGLDFARLTTWLAGAGINGCEGELRNFYDSI
mgnify:CR=1 FL=1